MFVGRVQATDYLYKMTGAQHRTGVTALLDRLKVQSIHKKFDTVTLQFKDEDGNKGDETGIYNPWGSQMRPMARQPYTHAKPDEQLQREIMPSSEKIGYTERDALLNQYMKQYRIDGRIEEDKIILTSDEPARLMLPDMVSDEELEAFRQQLSQNGLGQDIDWREVKSDLSWMRVSFSNAERLETKADYLASRYAVLKDRIQTQYTDDEQTQQMDILNQIYTDAKNEMADTYAEEIGGFYEDLGQEGGGRRFQVRHTRDG